MAVKETNNRFIMLLDAYNAPQLAQDASIWHRVNDPNDPSSATAGSGRVGQSENSIFYMGFSKNFNTVLNATRYPISDKGATASVGKTNSFNGYACCVEFKGYDSGYQGPMPSQAISNDEKYDKEWLTILAGQSQKIGVFPVNIALHTYVDNDYVAAHALAQAWLLKDANKINKSLFAKVWAPYGRSVPYDVIGGKTIDGASPCVYKYIHAQHIKNEPFYLNPGGFNENRILYNCISSLRKNAYFRKYGDDMPWTPIKKWWAARSNFQGVNACNCMNYYDYTFELPWAGSKRCDSRWLVTTRDCLTKSYAGGYVSLHHLHFTTYGNTAEETGPYVNMYFYIPRSTGEAATEIPLRSGKYDPSTNTTHYWVYFNINRKTNLSYYDDNYVESGWSYESPINIPVGKVYSKITPVCCCKDTQLPREGSTNINTPIDNYGCTSDRLSIGSVYINDGSDSSPVQYIASFTTSFNIYIATKSTVVSSFSKNSNGIVLGAEEGSTNELQQANNKFKFEKEEKDTFNQIEINDELINIEDDIPIQEKQSEDLDPDNELVGSVTEPAGVQICSITGLLVDDTWAFSHINSAFWNLEYARHMAPYIRVHHHTCIGYWGEWLDTPKMHGLLLLQHCCSNGGSRRIGTTPDGNITPPPELSHSMYCPGREQTTTTVSAVSSEEEPSFILNNGETIKNSIAAPVLTSQMVNENFKFGDVYNVIKVSNNNAKLRIPTEENYHLNIPSAHNRGLYTACNDRQTAIVTEEENKVPTRVEINENGTTGEKLVKEWVKNHVNDSILQNNDPHAIIDTGVSFYKYDGKYCVRTYQTDLGSTDEYLMNKVEKNVDTNATPGFENLAGKDEELNSKNLSFVSGRLGSIPTYVRKYRAKFSIAKDSVRINGISLNKMATKFPLEARSKDIPNIITFKLKIDFKYYYVGDGSDRAFPKMDSNGIQYYKQLPLPTIEEGHTFADYEYYEWSNGVHLSSPSESADGKKLANTTDPTYGNPEFMLYNTVTYIPEIFDPTLVDGESYGVKNSPIIPFYNLYNDDLFIENVGTTENIILPAKYSKDFPYYNVSLRLPLTAIDEDFCSKIGNNKFIGAPCYDISNKYTTYDYLNEDGIIISIKNEDCKSDYSYHIEESNYNEENYTYRKVTDEELALIKQDINTEDYSRDENGYLLDAEKNKVPEQVSDLSDESTRKICSIYGIQSDKCPLKGVKYEFKILKADILGDTSEVLTCFIKVWNDSDTFGFLDFSFKFPKFYYDTNNDKEFTGNELDSYTIEGSTTLSNLLSKILIKGVEVDTNEILFNTSSFKTSIRKALNTEVTSLSGGAGGGSATQDNNEYITSPETSVSSNLKDYDLINDGAISEGSIPHGEILSSSEDGVMNIGIPSDDDNNDTEVLIDPKYFAILNRTTGEILGVGNDSEINFSEYGRFIEEYLTVDPNDPTKKISKTAGQGEDKLGMKYIENRCLSRDLLPILSNKIVVY